MFRLIIDLSDQLDFVSSKFGRLNQRNPNQTEWIVLTCVDVLLYLAVQLRSRFCCIVKVKVLLYS